MGVNKFVTNLIRILVENKSRSLFDLCSDPGFSLSIVKQKCIFILNHKKNNIIS